jgi:hypothetical protein
MPKDNPGTKINDLFKTVPLVSNSQNNQQQQNKNE